MKENPVSPKIWAVIGALVSPGLVLLVLGAVLDIDVLVTVGVSLLGGTTLAAGAGYVKDDPDRVVGKRKKRVRKPLGPVIRERSGREAGQAGVGLVVFVLVVILVVVFLKAVTGSWLVLLLLLLLLLAFAF